MFPLLPIPQTLSPGSSLIVWQGRLPERGPRPLPLIEILPGDRADVALSRRQQRGAELYTREGPSGPAAQTGTLIDFYC